MHLIGVHLIGVHLIGVHLMGLRLMGVCLKGVHLIGQCLIPCTADTQKHAQKAASLNFDISTTTQCNFMKFCVSETNNVAILLYMISACARIRYHCAVISVLYGLVP